VIGPATVFPDAPIRIKLEWTCPVHEAHLRAGQLAAGDDIVIPTKEVAV